MSNWPKCQKMAQNSENGQNGVILEQNDILVQKLGYDGQILSKYSKYHAEQPRPWILLVKTMSNSPKCQ